MIDRGYLIFNTIRLRRHALLTPVVHKCGVDVILNPKSGMDHGSVWLLWNLLWHLYQPGRTKWRMNIPVISRVIKMHS